MNKITSKQLLNSIRLRFQFFPSHLVERSIWPLLLSFSLFSLAISAVQYMHDYSTGFILLRASIVLTMMGMGLWWKDVIIEASFLGNHTKKVKEGILQGFILFVISEIMVFLSVFWAYAHSSLSPALEIGSCWPPIGITPLDAFAIPFINTLLLLSSGESHIDLLEINFTNFSNLIPILPFSKPKIGAKNRVGPHNFNILSILICSLLGDSYAAKDPGHNGTSIRFYYGLINIEYAFFIHSLISNLGYCSPVSPKVQYRKIENKWNSRVNTFVPALNDKTIRGIIRFNTFSFSSFNWIRESFYPNGIKIIPSIIDDYLTAQGLAILIMDDGCYIKNKGIRIATLSYTYEEVLFLSQLITKKFNLKTTIQKGNLIENTYQIYITKDSLPQLIKLIKPFMVPSMFYKLGISNI